jgi:hypothetical protein
LYRGAVAFFMLRVMFGVRFGSLGVNVIFLAFVRWQLYRGIGLGNALT